MIAADHTNLCLWTTFSKGKKIINTGTKSGPESHRSDSNGHSHEKNGWGEKINGFYTDTDTFHPTSPAEYVKHKVNECLFIKDICGLGKCIDIEDGYVDFVLISNVLIQFTYF